MSKSEWSHLYANRKWRRLRLERLNAEPLCRYCKQQGRVTEATVLDHITPHKGDMVKFWSGPFQSLCATCHSSRKAKEDAGFVHRLDARELEGSHWKR